MAFRLLDLLLGSPIGIPGPASSGPWWWYVIAVIFGLALGLFAGRFLNAILMFWESTAVAVKAFRTIILFLLTFGGAAGALWLFKSDDLAIAYCGGLGLGLLIAFFMPLPAVLTARLAKQVARVQEAIPEGVTDRDQRRLLSLNAILPPEALRRTEAIDSNELGRRLETALDNWIDAAREEEPPTEEPEGDDD